MRFDRRILFTGLSLGAFALSLALLIHTQARLNYARAELLRAATPELPVQEALPLTAC